ncbi:ATRAD3, putative [Medicago truncatula]|uniref:ATRAD3, putative n=1 Tax=Medicago truncatula TaxID=3880 RepID=G7JBU8_MEDTR|nr:ATRAD3, putative [Medicago truncatula]
MFSQSKRTLGLPVCLLFSFLIQSNKTVNWSGFSCKNFECLNGKKLNRGCMHCFDLVNGYENQRVKQM